MTRKLACLFIVPIALGLVAFCIFMMGVLFVSVHGGVCNYSSIPVWLTLTESGRQKAFSLPAGQCTHVITQDAEAIWGKDCHMDPCQYQAWKISAGRFEIYDRGDSASGFILQIQGWGARSRWHITRDWPKPNLSSINYLLVR